MRRNDRPPRWAICPGRRVTGTAVPELSSTIATLCEFHVSVEARPGGGSCRCNARTCAIDDCYG